MDIRENVEMPTVTRDSKYAEVAAKMAIGQCVMFDKKNEALTLQRAMVILKRAGKVRQMADGPHKGKWGCWLLAVDVPPKVKPGPKPASALATPPAK